MVHLDANRCNFSNKHEWPRMMLFFNPEYAQNNNDNTHIDQRCLIKLTMDMAYIVV